MKQRKQKVVIMRYPTFMEDEGRHLFVRIEDSIEDAEKWLAQQVGEYYSPSDYYYLSGPESPQCIWC